MANSVHDALAGQSLGRPLSQTEQALSDALVKSFTAGEHDFETIAQALQRDNVTRPSGTAGAWTAAALEDELSRINASLDAAYVEHGIGA